MGNCSCAMDEGRGGAALPGVGQQMQDERKRSRAGVMGEKGRHRGSLNNIYKGVNE